MRILLDTNILIRAIISPGGPAREIIRHIERDEGHVLILSSYLLDEVERVLADPRIQKRFPRTLAEIQHDCSRLDTLSEQVLPEPLGLIVTDPKDQAVVETAVAGRAEVLCTRDEHFFAPEVREFLRQHSVRLTTDLELLDTLRG